jgi:hypothetical protein
MAKHDVERQELYALNRGEAYIPTKAQTEQASDQKRYFSCVADSHNTEVIFFKCETILPVIRIHDIKFIQKIFRERSTVLN